MRDIYWNIVTTFVKFYHIHNDRLYYQKANKINAYLFHKHSISTHYILDWEIDTGPVSISQSNM